MSDTPTKPIGYINFDGAPGDNNEVEIVVPYDRLDQMRRGQYVLLSSTATGTHRHYLARIIRGPFYVPDAVSKDSAFARASILQADEVKFRPDYHGVCKAEVLGELPDAESFAVAGAFSRPVPQTAVVPLLPARITLLLGLDGDMYLGKLTGYPVKVNFKSNNKAVIPRNLGVFGTVGSGKTNTSQVLIEEATQAGFAVVVLDVEGEYVEMDKPSREAREKATLRRKMEEYAIKPDGLKELKVYHCIGTDPQREEDSQEIGIRFANIDRFVMAELLDLSSPQHDLFIGLYYDLERQADRKPKAHRGVVAALSGKDDKASVGIDLADLISEIEDKLGHPKVEGRVSWQVILRKLKKLQRYGIFDAGKDLGDYSCLMQPQLVSVFDLSGSQNVIINNILISDILRGLFEQKVRDKDRRLPPTLVVIEEAHTFVSKDNVKRMEETLDILRDISRRGRKRWLALCFISQQPSHLPPEIYELCNTKIVHQTTGKKNLDALKESAGGVNEAIWGEVPVLGQGRCLIISPQFKHPVLCDMRPCKSERRMTD